MHVARELIVIVTVVAAIAGVARRIGRTAPLVLVVAGIIVSYLPGVDDMAIDPDIVLVGILPPLLYAAAIRTSLVDFRSNVRPIALLSVGYIGFTTVCIGFIAWWLLPVPLAAAFALGAVVAPPDAVAATSIARKVGMPRRVVTILEGESLVNDATAIVCLRTAIAAMAGSVTALEITGDFVRSVLGGVGVGVLAAFVIGHIRKKLDDIVLDTTISLVSPWVAYLAAEEIHASGVLAVVVLGLLLGHKAYMIQSAPSRLLERGNWATVQFILEHVVFFLIGLQARTIIDDVADSTLSAATIALAAAVVLVAVIVLRFVWVFPATYVPRWVSRRIAGRDPAPPWQVPTVISWAGMRGVVTIAAVFLLPDDTPHREALVLIALVVAAGTLLIQGPTLPWLVRRLGLVGPNAAQDLLTEALIYQKAARAGLAALDNATTGDEPANILARLRISGLERADAAWESLGGDGETPSQVYARLRAIMLDSERAAVLQARDEGAAPDEVLRKVLGALDVEESVLINYIGSAVDRAGDLTAADLEMLGCPELREAERNEVPDPRTPDGCEECLRDGMRWVHLRLCLTCGHVGCCDSSEGRHADGHFHETSHPVMRSFEPDELWRWCYLHDQVG
jgi:CPA1 family monovalent cation:H+ antiporter